MIIKKEIDSIIYKSTTIDQEQGRETHRIEMYIEISGCQR